jgi:hypothetical protein
MHVRQGNRPTQPQNVPDKIYAIMSKCWNRDWRTRWTFSSLRRVLERELSMLDPPLPERDIGAYLQDVVRISLWLALIGVSPLFSFFLEPTLLMRPRQAAVKHLTGFPPLLPFMNIYDF